MKHLQQGYQGFSIFMGLQIDRVLSIVTVGLAIALATFIAQL